MVTRLARKTPLKRQKYDHAYYAAYYEKNREKLRARAKAWNARNRNTGRPTGRPRLRKDVRGRGGPDKKALDRLFSLIVRAGGSCVRCGAIERLQCAHIVSRRYLGVRFDSDNALCLCSGCHMYFTYRPLEWETYITERMGEEAYAALKRKALAFAGPLDRIAVAQILYAAADVAGVRTSKGAPGGTVVGLRDPDREYEVSGFTRARTKRRAEKHASGGAEKGEE